MPLKGKGIQLYPDRIACADPADILVTDIDLDLDVAVERDKA